MSINSNPYNKANCFWLLISVCLFLSCSNRSHDKLTIAGAANVQFALEEMTQTFTEATGIECQIITASSGKLTAQIIAGAPYDIFLSADLKYPEEVYKAGLSDSKPEVYAYGQLVMWSLASTPKFEALADQPVQTIAIANPKTAPYGRAAMEALQAGGFLSKTEKNLVYGESISQVNQFVISKSAHLGFTAKSVVVSPMLRTTGFWTLLDDSLYSPIAQGLILVNHKSARRDEAEKFRNFIYSTKGAEILARSGYRLPGDN